MIGAELLIHLARGCGIVFEQYARPAITASKSAELQRNDGEYHRWLFDSLESTAGCEGVSPGSYDSADEVILVLDFGVGL